MKLDGLMAALCRGDIHCLCTRDAASVLLPAGAPVGGPVCALARRAAGRHGQNTHTLSQLVNSCARKQHTCTLMSASLTCSS